MYTFITLNIIIYMNIYIYIYVYRHDTKYNDICTYIYI